MEVHVAAKETTANEGTNAARNAAITSSVGANAPPKSDLRTGGESTAAADVTNEKRDEADDADWVTVTGTEEQDDAEKRRRSSGFSSQFDFTVGWGERKLTVLQGT